MSLTLVTDEFLNQVDRRITQICFCRNTEVLLPVQDLLERLVWLIREERGITDLESKIVLRAFHKE